MAVSSMKAGVYGRLPQAPQARDDYVRRPCFGQKGGWKVKPRPATFRLLSRLLQAPVDECVYRISLGYANVKSQHHLTVVIQRQHQCSRTSSLAPNHFLRVLQLI